MADFPAREAEVMGKLARRILKLLFNVFAPGSNNFPERPDV